MGINGNMYLKVKKYWIIERVVYGPDSCPEYFGSYGTNCILFNSSETGAKKFNSFKEAEKERKKIIAGNYYGFFTYRSKKITEIIEIISSPKKTSRWELMDV